MLAAMLPLLFVGTGCAGRKRARAPDAAIPTPASAPAPVAAPTLPSASAPAVVRPLAAVSPDEGTISMEYEPADFRGFPLETADESRCSPNVKPDFVGIVIRMPERITAAHDERIVVPMCGYYRLPTSSVMEPVDVRVHARNLATSVEISGPINAAPPPGVTMAAPRQPVDRSRFDGQLSRTYLNFDGQKYLPASLPAGKYEIWLSYGSEHSNAARVEIVRS